MHRVREFLRASDERVCDRLVPTSHGTALVTRSLPLVWQLNSLRVEDPSAQAAEVAAEAERLQRDLSHRKIVVHHEEHGARIAPDLAGRGWNVVRLLVMAKRRPPDRPAEPGWGTESDRATAARTFAAFRREQPFGWQQGAIDELEQMDLRYTRGLGGRDFLAPAGSPVSGCRLYSDGRTAQIDEVGTLQTERSRGYARAAVLAASDAAAADGHDLIFLLTDASDWPQHLYRRLGFDPVGSVYEFLRVGVGSAA